MGIPVEISWHPIHQPNQSFSLRMEKLINNYSLLFRCLILFTATDSASIAAS